MAEPIDDREFDVNAGPGGVGLRTKGYRLMDLAWMGSVIGITYIAFVVSAHNAQAGKEMTDVAQTLKTSNAEVAAALKDSTKQTIDALKEMARATREQTCVLTLPQEKRNNMAETCRRISQ